MMMIEAPDIGTRKVACCYPESNCWDCHWHHWPRPTWMTASPRGRGWSPPSAGRTSCWTRRGGSSSAGRWWARPAGCSPSAPASAARRSPSWTRCPSCCCSSWTNSWLQTPGCVAAECNMIWLDYVMLSCCRFVWGVHCSTFTFTGHRENNGTASLHSLAARNILLWTCLTYIFNIWN